MSVAAGVLASVSPPNHGPPLTRPGSEATDGEGETSPPLLGGIELWMRLIEQCLAYD